MSRAFVLAAVLLSLAGCESTAPSHSLTPVQSGQSVTLAQPVTIFEQRGLVKLEWQLLPGTYVERYRMPQGRVFQGEGALVQFTPTMGGKTLNAGGFIVLDQPAGTGKLYIVKRGETPAQFGIVDTAIAQTLTGSAGDLSLVADFPLSRIKRGKW